VSIHKTQLAATSTLHDQISNNSNTERLHYPCTSQRLDTKNFSILPSAQHYQTVISQPERMVEYL